MLLAAIGIVVGTLSLLIDLGNRLFGSYARTFWGAGWRVVLVTICCVGMLSPLGWLTFDPVSPSARMTAGAFGVLGLLLLVHFLFPYRFGIQREQPPDLSESVSALVGGMILRDLALPLPEARFGGERLVAMVLTDLHCNTDAKLELLEKAFRALPGEGTDLVLVLGDFGENPVLLPGVFTAIASIRSRFGIFVVRGNHDCEGGRTQLIAELAARDGMRLLSNETAALPVAGAVLLGIERPWLPGPMPPVAGTGIPVALAHTPDNLPALSRINVPLVLAGHTHGGKLRLPLMGAVLVPSRHGRLLDRGWFRLRATWLYLCPGVGYFPTARHPGEIARLTLLASGRSQHA